MPSTGRVTDSVADKATRNALIWRPAFPQGLRTAAYLCRMDDTAKKLRKKTPVLRGHPEKHVSELRDPIGSALFTNGLRTIPCNASSFSAARKIAPFQKPCMIDRSLAFQMRELSSRCALKPALASAAMARSTGAIGWAELSRADPTLTSFTTTPSVAPRAWVTRRTHDPQCIPSIFNVNSTMISLPALFDDSGMGSIRAWSHVAEG